MEKLLLWGWEGFVHYLQLKRSFIFLPRVPVGLIKIAERDLIPASIWSEELLLLLFYTLNNFLCLEGFHVWSSSYMAFQNTFFRGDAFQKTSLFCWLALEERHMWKRFKILCFLSEINQEKCLLSCLKPCVLIPEVIWRNGTGLNVASWVYTGIWAGTASLVLVSGRK